METVDVLTLSSMSWEQQYGRMHSRLQLLMQQGHPRIRRNWKTPRTNTRRHSFCCRKNVKGSRSPTVAALSGAQLDYFRTLEKVLAQANLEQTEAAALYAEYAMDFATQSTRYALMAALKAMDLQMTMEEKKEETQNET